MLKATKKYLATTALLALAFAFSFILLPQNDVHAQDLYEPIYFTPQIEIPNSMISGQVPVGQPGADGYVNSDLLAKYISAVYNYGLGIGGVLATVMLMVSGIIWLTSAGDSGKIGNAKKLMIGSIVGMGLLYGAFLLLNTINPDLVALKGIRVMGIKNQITNDAADGFIDNLDNAPTDIQVNWVCMPSESQTCANTVPPTINLDISICYKEKGTDTKPVKDGGACNYIWCCGLSAIDTSQRNEFCQGESTGTACRLTSTGRIGEGYCLNGICTPCKKLGETCSGGLTNYECVGASGFCGKKSDGSSDCDCVWGNCTCKKTW